MNLWWGLEGRGWDAEQQLRLGVYLHLHRQVPVIAAARSGGDPFGNFLLDQKDGVEQIRAESENMFHDRRRNVIGEVAGHLDRPPLAKIALENVGVRHRKIGFVSKFLAKVLDEDLI